MNHSFLSVETTIREEQRGERNTRLHGRRLVLARVLWVVIAVFELKVPHSFNMLASPWETFYQCSSP